MAPLRLRGGEVRAVRLPVRDVNDFVAGPAGVWMFTSDGVVQATEPESLSDAGRAKAQTARR